MGAVISWLSQSAPAGEWAPMPYLSVGTLLALGGVVAVFGAMKSRTDSIPEWRKEIRDEMAEMRKERREDHTALRAELSEIRESVTDLSNAVARLDARGRPHDGL